VTTVRRFLASMNRPIAIGFVLDALSGSAVARVLRSGIPAVSGLDVLDPVPDAMAVALFARVVGWSICARGRRAICINPSTALQHE
jgi:hypothetical protein